MLEVHKIEQKSSKNDGKCERIDLNYEKKKSWKLEKKLTKIGKNWPKVWKRLLSKNCRRLIK